jgi:hypothetical protein
MCLLLNSLVEIPVFVGHYLPSACNSKMLLLWKPGELKLVSSDISISFETTTAKKQKGFV